MTMSEDEAATTVEIDSIVLTKVSARVIVECAPKRSVISLEVIQRSDPELLFISGDCLYLGNTRVGEEICYRVTAWQQSPPALVVVREDAGPPERGSQSALSTASRPGESVRP
jgi:hypothetical protein